MRLRQRYVRWAVPVVLCLSHPVWRFRPATDKNTPVNRHQIRQKKYGTEILFLFPFSQLSFYSEAPNFT